MKYELSYADYEAIATIATPETFDLRQTYVSCLDAITVRWLKTLSSDKVCTLLFIMNRTLKFGKYAEKISFPAFMDGVDSEEKGPITSGLNISHNTFRRILAELVADGFVHSYSPKPVDGKIDNAIRYFEINFKRLQALPEGKDGEIMSILRTPRPKKIVADTPPKFGSPNKNLLKDTTYLSRQPAAVGAGREELSAKDKVEALMKAQRAKRDAQIVKASSTKFANLRKAELQAVIDKAMLTYHPSLPRSLVTDKALSVMKRRVAAAPPESLPAFLEWAVCFWEQTVQSHTRSLNRKRRGGEAVDTQPLPAVFDFTTLAYRYPYFLKVYTNAQVMAGKFGEKKDIDNEKIKKLEVALQNKKAENEVLRKTARDALRVRKEAQPAPQPRQRPSRAVPLDDDDPLPSWEQLQSRRAR